MGAAQSGYRKHQLLMKATIPSHYKPETAGKHTLIRAIRVSFVHIRVLPDF